MLTLLPGNSNELESACWPFLLVTALDLDGTASAQTFFLLMEDGHKVVLFYISNALIQDIPFWPLFVLATAAQQQEGKNGTTSVILFIFLQSGLLGRLGQPVEHGHMDIMRETLSFHHHVSWHCYPDLSKKCLAHLWCHPHFVHASAAEGIFRVYLTCLTAEFWQELLLQRS